jgi:hypothetical protein
MEMLKRMVQSESLGLFRKFEDGPGAKVLAESEENKAGESEPEATVAAAAAAEPIPAEITETSASNVTMPQDGAEDDVPKEDPDQTVASLNIVPEQKIK